MPEFHFFFLMGWDLKVWEKWRFLFRLGQKVNMITLMDLRRSHFTVSRHSPMKITRMANTTARKTGPSLWGVSVSHPPSLFHPAVRSAVYTWWPVCPSVCTHVHLPPRRLLRAVSRRSRALNHSKLGFELPSAPVGSRHECRAANLSVGLVPLPVLLSHLSFVVFAFAVHTQGKKKKKAAVHWRTEAFRFVFFPEQNQTSEMTCFYTAVQKIKVSVLHNVSRAVLFTPRVRIKEKKMFLSIHCDDEIYWDFLKKKYVATEKILTICVNYFLVYCSQENKFWNLILARALDAWWGASLLQHSVVTLADQHVFNARW